MDELLNWLNLVFRFVHVLAAIMWVGSSIFFNWLDGHITAREGSDDEQLEGDLWMIHGGGVYLVEKRRLEPGRIPPVLHWFKWEAYTTWISGFCLLLVMFHAGGDLVLMLHGLGSLFVGLLVYELVWRSPLQRLPAFASALSFILLVLAAWGLTEVLNGRSAFIHVGALLGTIMAANVFLHIIPNQKKVMAALRGGGEHDQDKSRVAKMRSRHNNYITFPVLFIMISNHYVSLTEHWLNWLILALFMVMLGVIKHFMNIRRSFPAWLLAVCLTFLFGSAAIYGVNRQPPPAVEVDPELAATNPAAAAGQQLFANYGCAACHQPVSTPLGPVLHGLLGREEELLDGTRIVADEAYIRESILLSQKQIVKGFIGVMPPFEGVLSEQQVDDLVAYILSLEPE